MLTTQRLKLVPSHQINPEAHHQYWARNVEFLRPWIPKVDPRTSELSYWESHCETSEKEWKYDTAVRFGILWKNKLIGKVHYSQIFRGVFQACYLGYSLSEEESGQGFATEAIQASIDYMFDHRNLHRIMANYVPRNRPSAAVLKKLGFVEEGHAKDYLQIAGKWEDHILTSLTNSHWRG